MDTSSRAYKILKRSQRVDDTDDDDSSCSESDCDLPQFMEHLNTINILEETSLSHSGNHHIIY